MMYAGYVKTRKRHIQVHSVEWVSEMKSMLPIILYTVFGSAFYQLTHISSNENIGTTYHYPSQIGNMIQ